MDSAGVTVVIANHNTAPFLAVSLRALRELTETPYTVLVSDDGSEPADLALLDELDAAHDEVTVLRRRPTRSGSGAHAEALDFLRSRVETAYTAVLDADCTPLMRGWDTYLIGRLGDRVKIVGSTLGEGWSGRKPIDFPLPFMAMLETAPYRELGISALPRDIEAGEDTCWEWRPKYRAAGYDGAVVRSQNTRLTPEGPFADVPCAVYYADDGRVLGSHFGRGANPAGKRQGRGVIGGLLTRVRGDDARVAQWRAQRERWIATCHALIDEHAPARA